ncbi:Uncharacterised protein [Serratia plymuthica]|uniref:Uncharacterized protein n=1 Tax=Serratia plymuthica TaxID=82996 RepID=A0A2X4ULT3_SERPL|nr:Uncharacterised protein [Serratia plymuthica]
MAAALYLLCTFLLIFLFSRQNGAGWPLSAVTEAAQERLMDCNSVRVTILSTRNFLLVSQASASSR